MTQYYSGLSVPLGSPSDAKLIMDTGHIKSVAMGSRAHTIPIAHSSITLIAVCLQCEYIIAHLEYIFIPVSINQAVNRGAVHNIVKSGF